MKKVLIVLASIVFISQVAAARAESTTPAILKTVQVTQNTARNIAVQKATSEAATARTKQTANAKERMANRCVAMTDYVEQKESQYTKMEEQIATIQEKLQNIVATFQAEGMDTSQLQSTITALQTASTMCLSSQQEMLARLVDTKTRSCSADDSRELAAAIKLARSARLDRTANCAAMRETFVQQVKPAIAELKAAYRTTHGESSASNDRSDSTNTR